MAKTPGRPTGQTNDDKNGTPLMVAIGPIPEWSHLGLSSLVPNQRLLLVPSQDTDCVSIVDLEAMKVRNTIQLPKGSSPWFVKATADGRHALVSYSRFHGHIDTADKRDSAVGVIDLRSETLVNEIKVMAGPVMIETDGRRNRAYVTNRYSNTVSVIDLNEMTVVETVKTGAAPFWIKLTPAGDRLVVGNFEDASLSIYDADKLALLATLPVGTPLKTPFPEFGVGDTIGFAITNDGTAIVANWRSHTVVEVDINAVEKSGRRAIRSATRRVKFPFNVEWDEESGLLVVGSYDVPDSRLVVMDYKAGAGLDGLPISDIPVDGTRLPEGKAAGLNYWMSQPFESRIIGFLARGVAPVNPIDLVALVL